MTVMEKLDLDGALARQRERTKETREHMAGIMFGWDNLNKTLSLASAAGQSAAIIRPEIPMDVSDTETAKTAVKLLQEAGFLAEWETKQQPEGEPWKYLRVSWGADAKAK